jgi:hypothetical protein
MFYIDRGQSSAELRFADLGIDCGADPGEARTGGLK